MIAPVYTIDNALVSRILRAALAELRRPIDPDTGNGWTREAYGEPQSCKCAAGAIRLAVSAEFGTRPKADTLWFSKWHDVSEAACERLCAGAGISPPAKRALPGYFEGSVISWNDAADRTFAEVEGAFEKAIDINEAAA